MTMSKTRSSALRQVLLTHKLKGQHDVDSRVREGRTARARDVGDSLDSSDADVQSGLDFSLLQMRAATVARIDQALVRLDAGQYGSCVECGKDIAAQRLRVLPFAVRCHECEAEREAEQGYAGVAPLQRGGATLFPERIGR